MKLPRALVGFSKTDIDCYRRMQDWRLDDGRTFDFCDSLAAVSPNPDADIFSKHKFLEQLERVRTYVALIGTDTSFKESQVRWEVNGAVMKRLRIIAVNLDGWRRMNAQTCPSVLQDVGATFILYSPEIIAYALDNAVREPAGNWEFPDDIYVALEYTLSGSRAIRGSTRRT